MNLRIVGPTPLPESVRQALARPMINHRGAEFAAIQAETVAGLKTFFQTSADVFVAAASGTGGLEAAIVNTLSPGDKAIACAVGVFGDRFAAIARAFGVAVVKVDAEWGQAMDPGAVARALAEHPDAKAVLATHNETSTGVTNPLEAIAQVVRAHSDAVLLVDAISALGAIDLPVDAWGVDVAITGSQKSWMIPPGLTMFSVSDRAWRANAQARCPRFYWDFAALKTSFEKNQSPFTPAVGLFFALHEALRLMQAEGMAQIFARHHRVAAHTRRGVEALGLSLFPDERHASDTVTAIRVPPGVEAKRLREIMRTEYDVVIAGGQRSLDGKIVRIGHLGQVVEADIDDALNALGGALKTVGFSP